MLCFGNPSARGRDAPRWPADPRRGPGRGGLGKPWGPGVARSRSSTWGTSPTERPGELGERRRWARFDPRVASHSPNRPIEAWWRLNVLQRCYGWPLASDTSGSDSEDRRWSCPYARRTGGARHRSSGPASAPTPSAVCSCGDTGGWDGRQDSDRGCDAGPAAIPLVAIERVATRAAGTERKPDARPSEE